ASDEPFSVSAWIYRTGEDTTFSGIVAKDQGSPNREWCLGYDVDNDEIRFFIKSQGTDIQQSIDSTTKIELNQWYHVVATYNANESYTGIQIYINGQTETPKDPYNQSYVAMSDTTSPLTIGRYFNSDNRAWIGAIDEVAIWDRALDPVHYQK
ncbi:LamG domain-containing protein, partial [Candidatus Omnitrophota bacterium]